MKTFIFVLVLALLIIVLLWFVLYKLRKPKDDVVVYTCNICDERDCICHKEKNT